jgi:hypothetical protein
MLGGRMICSVDIAVDGGPSSMPQHTASQKDLTSGSREHQIEEKERAARPYMCEL